MLVVAGCFFLAIGLLSPTLIYSEVSTIPMGGRMLTTCALNMPPTIAKIFISYLFVIGYVLPAICMTFCYSKLLAVVFRQMDKFSNSHKRMRKVDFP